MDVGGLHHGCAVAFCGPFVIRRPVDSYHCLRFTQEVTLLQGLARSALPAAIPELVWHCEDPPVMIYRRIEGTTAPMTFGDLAAPPGNTLLFACGYFVGHLHSLRAGRHGVPALPAIEADTLDYLAQVLVAAELPDDVHAFGAEALHDWRARSGRTLAPCIVHGDLNWRNVVLTTSRSRLAGVIDWSISGVADPHLDFGFLAAWGAERFAAAAAGYKAATGRKLDLRAVDAAVRLRRLAALLHARPADQAGEIAAARAHVPVPGIRQAI